jgi:hypothetical protein
LCFDEAMARCESGGAEVRVQALAEMRAAFDALLYYNGGATLMHRYVSTRRPFIDPDFIIGDQEALAHVTTFRAAEQLVARVVDDMLAFVEEEARVLSHIFVVDEQRVMLMLLQRLCYERLVPTVETLMHGLDDLMQEDPRASKAPEDTNLHHNSSAAHARTHSGRANARLDCIVNILRSCAHFVRGLVSGVRETGPLVDKEVGEEISELVADLLAPHAIAFEQLQVLSTPVPKDLNRKPYTCSCRC